MSGGTRGGPLGGARLEEGEACTPSGSQEDGARLEGGAGLGGGSHGEGGARAPSLRYKTFSSQQQQQLVSRAAQKLQASGFYWGSLTGGGAERLLEATPPGTFLLRDSANSRHFFTLSVRTVRGCKNLRVQCDNSSFYLQSEPCSDCAPVGPRFDCVLKLLQHYMPGGGVTAPPCGENQECSPYFILSGGDRIPLQLLHPLYSSLSSLQHLCRKTLNAHMSARTNTDRLPHPLQDFLQEYDAPI